MDVDARLAALEAKLAELQDTLDVLKVVASYGPTVDSGASAEAGQLWTEDCTYDSDNAPEPLRGRTTIEELSARVGAMPIGVAHFTQFPIVTVDGDRAVAIAQSNTWHQEDGKYVVGRVSSNRFELQRVAGRWQINNRVNRILDGTEAGRDVFRQGIKESMA